MSISEELIEDVTNKSLFCICCMGQSGTFIILASCAHKEYLESFPISDLNLGIPEVVCSKCHDILKTVTRFKEQVWNSLNILLKKVNRLEKIESTKSNLEISETLHCNIERIDQVDNTEYLSDHSRKLKNISTALGIINSNAASMTALTSSQNFIGLTETLLQATTLGFNLPLMRETVLSKLRTNNLADSTSTSTVKLREDNSADVLPVDINQDLYKSNNIPEKNEMKPVNKTKNETVVEMIHENINRVRDNNGSNKVEFINVDESHILPVDKNKCQETGILHNITTENIEMEFEVIKTEPDLDIVQEKLRKPVNNREAVIAIHFEAKTRPINIKKESETKDPLSTNNENHFPEIFVKPEINEEIGDVGVVGTYGTAVLPDTIKFEPEDQEQVEDSYIDSDTATEADKSRHKDVKDGESNPGNRSLTELGYEQLMKQHGENLHSTESYTWKYPCDHCIIGFQYKENLIDHVKRKHPSAANQPPQRYLICNICQEVVPVTDFKEHHLRHGGFHSMTNMDDSSQERKRKRHIMNREKCKRYREKKKNEAAARPTSGSSDSDEKEREEERRQKNRERAKRFRDNKNNEVTLVLFGPLNLDEEKREQERKQRNREKVKRYRDKKKNEVTPVLFGPLNLDEEKREQERKQRNREKVKRYRENQKKKKQIAADSSSDSPNTKMKKARQKKLHAERCKRYRDRKRPLTQNIWNKKVQQQAHSSQIVSLSTRDVPNEPSIAGPSTST